MFVLDTNILSAIMATRPEPEAAAWIAARPMEMLFTTCMSHAEILSGLATMADGRRRRDLETAAREWRTSRGGCCHSIWQRLRPMLTCLRSAGGPDGQQQQWI